jgi:hypothetical protein
MKDFQRYLIVGVAAFCLGFVVQSVMGVTLRKAANSRFISESELELKGLRASLSAFHAKEKRFPAGVAELYSKGYLDPAQPPVESMRRSARWLSQWDGEGGFVYLSVTGQVYLNADVSREKFFRHDWKRVKDGGMFPPGKIN